jgi:branched-chain amino acid transport system ATP-binding protein
MLALNDLYVNYGRVPALHGISLFVREGEAVALVGPNGAGKTTTLSAIFGLVSIEAGTITFEGNSLCGLTPENIVRRGIALVPEGRHIFGSLTVAENLQLGTSARRDRSGVAAEIEKAVERFPALGQYYDRSAATLSGGEQQQLAIARALLCRPRLLLLDEPSLGLAPLVIDTVFDALEGLRQEGVTILLIEQNATRAIEFADRTYILRSGQMARTGTAEEMRTIEDLETLYLGI